MKGVESHRHRPPPCLIVDDETGRRMGMQGLNGATWHDSTQTKSLKTFTKGWGPSVPPKGLPAMIGKNIFNMGVLLTE